MPSPYYDPRFPGSPNTSFGNNPLMANTVPYGPGVPAQNPIAALVGGNGAPSYGSPYGNGPGSAAPGGRPGYGGISVSPRAGAPISAPRALPAPESPLLALPAPDPSTVGLRGAVNRFGNTIATPAKAVAGVASLRNAWDQGLNTVDAVRHGNWTDAGLSAAQTVGSVAGAVDAGKFLKDKLGKVVGRAGGVLTNGAAAVDAYRHGDLLDAGAKAAIAATYAANAGVGTAADLGYNVIGPRVKEGIDRVFFPDSSLGVGIHNMFHPGEEERLNQLVNSPVQVRPQSQRSAYAGGQPGMSADPAQAPFRYPGYSTPPFFPTGEGTAAQMAWDAGSAVKKGIDHAFFPNSSLGAGVYNMFHPGEEERLNQLVNSPVQVRPQSQRSAYAGGQPGMNAGPAPAMSQMQGNPNQPFPAGGSPMNYPQNPHNAYPGNQPGGNGSPDYYHYARPLVPMADGQGRPWDGRTPYMTEF